MVNFETTKRECFLKIKIKLVKLKEGKWMLSKKGLHIHITYPLKHFVFVLKIL